MLTDFRRSFLLFWVSQTLVILAVVVVVFSAGILIYHQTDSLSSFALIVMCGYLPEMLVMPLAGQLVDRLPRRRLLLGCSLAQAAVTGGGLLLTLAPPVSLPALYAVLIVLSLVGGVHRLGCLASVGLFAADSASYPRMNGLVQAGLACAHALGPLLAGPLLQFSAGWVVMLAAVGMCLIASLVLLRVRFPVRVSGPELRPCLHLGMAIRHIRSVPGLAAFMLLHVLANVARGGTIVLFTPFVLSFASEAVLGGLRATAGFGMALGAFLMTLWRWPRHALSGVLLALACCGLCILLMGAWHSPLPVAVLALLLFAATPILAALAHSIWQCRVPFELQGRVFGLRDMLAGAALASGYLLSPWLASGWLVPLTGSRADGIAVVFMLLGSLTLLLALLARCSRRIAGLADAGAAREAWQRQLL